VLLLPVSPCPVQIRWGRPVRSVGLNPVDCKDLCRIDGSRARQVRPFTTLYGRAGSRPLTRAPCQRCTWDSPTLTGLDRLEAQIDDALQAAKQLDPEGLTDVIGQLRTARNRVIVRVEGV